MRGRGAEHTQICPLLSLAAPSGRMRPGALQLAAQLCKALRVGDDAMVEALLHRGADPNLVLPEGIAAIHLAAGMEQESGIRCLALILQYGGDPNVRSVDDLTPVHVAASWGCYTCLRLLLLEGGNARLEDQDGNTALDLALEQGNEICVRMLQRSVEETGEEQSSWMPHRRAESFLTTATEDLLETGSISRVYDPYPDQFSRTPRSSPNETLRHVGPCSSFSRPIVPAPKSHPDCGIPGNCPDKNGSFEGRFSASFLTECSWRCSTLSEQCDLRAQPAASSIPLSSCSDAVGPASSRCAVRGFPDDGPVHPRSAANGATQTHYIKATTDGACRAPTDVNATLIDSDSCLSRVYPERPSTTGSPEIPQTCAMNSECKADHLLGMQESNATLNLSQYSSFLDPDLVVKLSSQEGLDVTSPDHVYLFSWANSTAVSDFDKTVVDPAFLLRACGNPDGCSARGKSSGSFDGGGNSSRYTSCDSECYASTTEAPCYSKPQGCEEQKARFGRSQASLDIIGSNSLLSRPCHGPRSGTSTCSSEGHRKPSVAASTSERISPARSESRGCLHDGTGFRETSSKMAAGMQTLDLRSTGKNECSGNTREPGLSRMSHNGVLAKRPSPKWENQEQYTLPLQELQKCVVSRARNKVLLEGSSDVTGERVATRELRGEFGGTVVSSEALAELTKEGSRRGVQETDLSISAQEVEERRQSLGTQDTMPILRVSEEMKPSLGGESLISPGMCGDVEDTMAIPDQTADTTMAIPHQTTSTKEDGSTSLEAKLRTMMFATKICHSPLLQPSNLACHVTPWTKSRTTASATHDSGSSSSLFDATLEMPRRPRRVRSPRRRTPTSSKARNWTDDLRERDPPSVAGEETDDLDDTQLIAAGPSSVKSSRNPGPSPSGLSIANPAVLRNSGGDVPRGDDQSAVKLGTHCSANLEEGELPAGNGEGDCATQEMQGAAPSGTDPERLGAPCRKAKRPPKPSRVSFSRMSAREQPFVSGTSGRLSPISQGVPLSPGGRPVNLSTTEPVEYLYVDEDEGHTLVERHVPCSDDSIANATSSEDTIIYDWRACKDQVVGLASKGNAPPQAPSELCQISDEALLRKLRDFGVNPGPVTGLTRKVYLQLLEKLMSDPKTKARKPSAGYSPELSSALETYQIPDGRDDEMALARQFDQPDKSKKWREGVLKSSFNYLLLDPRVTQNLPFRSQFASRAECFRTFVGAIFYVGKGKRSRPYSHLYEALTRYKDGRGRRGGQTCSKVQHILEIWASGQGVISMHCFQNVIPVEAYTREACMLDAIGLKMLTNQKKGNYYGVVAGWPMKRRRCLGVYLLHRAMQIFLAEGERQLRPADIRTGQ